MVIGDDQQPPTLNPYVPGGDAYVVGKIGQAIFARGWDIDAATRQLIPDVFVEIPSVTNGGVTVNGDGSMTVTYRIRDEAEWSDGSSISGADLAFTAEAVAPLLDPGDRFRGGERLYGLMRDIEVGDKTFTATIDETTIDYETLFEWILPRHVMEDTDLLVDWNEMPFLGAGPFVFDEWHRGDHITLVRNPNYWKFDEETGDRLPYLDEVVFRFVPEIDQLLAQFAEHRLDVIDPPPSAEDWSPVSLDDEAIVREYVPGGIWEHLAFQFGPNNRNAASINHNLDYRRAVAHAIGDSLDDIISYWIPIDSFLDAGAPELSTGAWSRYDYDPELARRLLDTAMAEEGVDSVTAVFSTTANADERPRIAAALQEALGAVGITYESQLEDSQLFFGDTLDLGTYDLGWWAWVLQPTTSSLLTQLDLFDPRGNPEEGQNVYRWGTADSAVDDELTARFAEIRDAANATLDRAEIERLVVEAEQLLADQVVIIPLLVRRSDLLYWGDALTGPEHNPTEASPTWNIEHWRRIDG